MGLVSCHTSEDAAVILFCGIYAVHVLVPYYDQLKELRIGSDQLVCEFRS